MLAAFVQPNITLHHIAFIFHIEIVKEMDEGFPVLGKFVKILDQTVAFCGNIEPLSKCLAI
jgi:hypothetical protein